MVVMRLRIVLMVEAEEVAREVLMGTVEQVVLFLLVPHRVVAVEEEAVVVEAMVISTTLVPVQMVG